jgi:hypothetical protein
MPNITDRNRQDLLQEMAQIQSMEKGTLTEEYRERLDPGGGTIRLGPYFKHQVWQEGANRSRRVPSDEVSALRQDLMNHARFGELADSYVELTVAETRAKRSKAAADPDAKKNSGNKPSRKAAAKRKPSSG